MVSSSAPTQVLDGNSSNARHGDPQLPTLRDVAAVLFRHKRLLAVTFVAILAASVVYAWTTPRYQARMKVLLRHGRLDPFVSPEQNSLPAVARIEISEEEVNSEVELLRDQNLLGKVVTETGLQREGLLSRIGLTHDTDEMRRARGVRDLAGRLRVDPIRKSNLIAISYTAAGPSLAARVLESLTQAYLEKHTAVHRSSEESPFFVQQANQSQTRLAAAEQRLMDFSWQRGVVSAALERDLALQGADELENGHRQVLVSVEETSKRIAALKKARDSFPPRSTSQMRTSDNPQLMGTLKQRLLELELRRTELLTRFQPNYRLVQETDAQIQQARSAIAAADLAPVREETTEKDPNYEWANSELEKAQVELTGLVAREAALRSALASSRGRAQALGEAAIQQQDLLRGMKTAEDGYLLYLRKSEEARIGDALDERGIVNVTVAEAPVAPALPQRSSVLILLLGLAGATCGSLAAAFVADYLDPGFRTPQELADCLRVPVLASLPREAA
jgi:uncharacterized protein involved in exopolysaccharide biosynthesis